GRCSDRTTGRRSLLSGLQDAHVARVLVPVLPRPFHVVGHRGDIRLDGRLPQPRIVPAHPHHVVHVENWRRPFARIRRIGLSRASRRASSKRTFGLWSVRSAITRSASTSCRIIVWWIRSLPWLRAVWTPKSAAFEAGLIRLFSTSSKKPVRRSRCRP